MTEEEEEEGEEQPVSAEEEDAGEEGVFAVITQLFMMIFTLFGLLGGGSRSEEVDEALDEAEDLLSGIVPSTGEMDETKPDGMQEDDDAMMERPEAPAARFWGPSRAAKAARMRPACRAGAGFTVPNRSVSPEARSDRWQTSQPPPPGIDAARTCRDAETFSQTGPSVRGDDGSRVASLP